MTYDPRIHHRRSIRLKGYDYSRPGYYFFTTCILDRRCILGDVADAEMRCNELGDAVWAIWRELPLHYPHVCLDAFVVMPNHVHGIIQLVGIPMPPGKRRHAFPEIVRSFKSFASRDINRLLGTPGDNHWQRDYWEHVVRTQGELERIRRYIQNNPRRWEFDRFHGTRPVHTDRTGGIRTIRTNVRTDRTGGL